MVNNKGIEKIKTNGLRVLKMDGLDVVKHIMEGRNVFKKYDATIPYSLLVDYLIEDEKITFNAKGKSEDFISLTFENNYKFSFENEMVKKEYEEYINECKGIRKEFNDKLKIELENKSTIEGYDEVESLKDTKFYSPNYIRNKFYKDGFTMKLPEFQSDKTIKYKEVEYVFCYRTSSQARVGSCIFCKKEIAEDIKLWMLMGLKFEEDAKIDLTSLLSYASLTASRIEKVITVKANEILVLDDLESTCLRNSISIFTDENKNVKAINKDNAENKNIIWDGMGLVDKSIFEENDYSKKGFMLLRQNFFKMCGFNANVQDYFKHFYKDKYDTATVKDRWGREVKVSDIKVITTDNATKWKKFDDGYEIFERVLERDKNKFGVCKVDHESNYGLYQRLSYQMLNSLPINKEELKKVAEYSIEYIENLKDNDENFIAHIKSNKNHANNYEMILAIYEKCHSIVNTSYFKKFKREEIAKLLTSLRKGKVQAEGDNMTVCGNPLLLLKYATGQLDMYIEENELVGYIDDTLPIQEDKRIVSVYCKRFENDKELVAFRNPHNAPNNICVFKNTINEEMDKWMNFNNNVVAINMIENDVQNRANGMDEDSDFMLISDNETLVKAGKEALDFKTIINDIPKESIEYLYNNKNIAAIDNKLAKGKKAVGTDSNYAQRYLSNMWDAKNNNKDEKEIKEIGDEVCIFSVLAQVAIDNAKRKFDVDLTTETNSHSSSLKSTKKPLFWKYTENKKTKEKNELSKLKKDFGNDLSEKELRKKKNEKLDKDYEKKLKDVLENDKSTYLDEETRKEIRGITVGCNVKNVEKAEKIRDKKQLQIVKKWEEDHCYDKKETPMDWLQDILDGIKNASRGSNVAIKDINDLLKEPKRNEEKKIDKCAIKKLLEELNNFRNKEKDIKANSEATTQEEKKEENLLLQDDWDELMKELKKLKLKVADIRYLIKEALTSEKSNGITKNRNKVLRFCWDLNPNAFVRFFEEPKKKEK